MLHLRTVKSLVNSYHWLSDQAHGTQSLRSAQNSMLISPLCYLKLYFLVLVEQGRRNRGRADYLS